jgi:hypothetical protein
MNDEEIIKLVTSFRKGVLGKKSPYMNCHIVSLPLQGYLSIIGINTNIEVGTINIKGFYGNHVWLKLEDGRIVDPTASQFNKFGQDMPDVYLGEKPEWYLAPMFDFYNE